MGFYFHPNGKPNLRFLTAQTTIMALLLINADIFSIHRIKDESMKPYFDKNAIVLYKHIGYSQRTSKLKNAIVAIQDPTDDGKIIMRRVIGVVGDWVQRSDNSSFIKIPNEHIWIESENSKLRQNDSITKFGPITRKLVKGTLYCQIYPKYKKLNEIEETINLK